MYIIFYIIFYIILYIQAAQGAHTLLVGKGEPSIDNWTFRLFYKVIIFPFFEGNCVTYNI